MIFFQDSHVTLYNADVLSGLQALPSDSVQCVVTSPPYWGLRDYGVDGQIGLEKTPDEFIARMVEVFREVRRVLRPDGTCWVNMGDSYAVGSNSATTFRRDKAAVNPVGRLCPSGLKPKDLCMIPERLAIAIQADGWWIRSEIIWAKPNPMPESVTDRPTKSHEKIYLLTKSANYFYDAEAVKEPHKAISLKRIESGLHHKHPDNVGVGSPPVDTERMGERFCPPGGRNLRTVWTIATQSYKEAHFATFPEKIPERCIMAGTSERGCCPECGSPWIRVLEHKSISRDELPPENPNYRPSRYDDGKAGDPQAPGPGQRFSENTTLGWSSSCKCGMPESENVPCTVMDIFGGSGTTGAVAKRLNRRAILIELNPEYCEMITRRISPQGVLI